MNEVFERQDMAGVVFHDVNLHGARFENVNLAEATIRNANLANLSIRDVNIMDLTVFGFRVDEIISAELDRRDLERAKLRMKDPHDPQSVLRVMRRLEKLRKSFYATLRKTSPQRLRRDTGDIDFGQGTVSGVL